MEAYGNTWSEARLPDNQKLYTLAYRLLQWNQRAADFADCLRRAVRDDSPFQVWLGCGHRLGECAAGANYAGTEKYSKLQYFVQETVQKLPPPYIEAISWLNSYSDFNFNAGRPDNWNSLAIPFGVGEMQRFVVRLKRLRKVLQRKVQEQEVKTFGDLIDYVRRRFVHSIWRRTRLGTDAVEARHDEAEADQVHARPAFEVRATTPRPSTADQVMKPPTVKWDESSGELLVDGKKIEDCPAEIIRRTGMREDAFRRDAFLYAESMRLEPYDAIVRKLAKHTEWDPIGTISGIKAAARRFAARFHLPPVIPRTSTGSKDASR